MNYLLKANKNLLIYSLVIILIFPILGIKFLISFIGNILLLFFLIPILILLLILIGFNYYKSKLNVSNDCGEISLGLRSLFLIFISYLYLVRKNTNFEQGRNWRR